MYTCTWHGAQWSSILIITLNTTHTKSETELLIKKINNCNILCHEPCFFSSFSALLILLTAFGLSFVLSDKVSLDTAEQSSVSTCLISLVVTAWLFLIAEWPSVLVQTSVEMVPAGWSVADAVYTNTHVAKKSINTCIARNFWGRKILWICEKYDFAEKTFVDCSLLLCQRMPHP